MLFEKFNHNAYIMAWPVLTLRVNSYEAFYSLALIFAIGMMLFSLLLAVWVWGGQANLYTPVKQLSSSASFHFHTGPGSCTPDMNEAGRCCTTSICSAAHLIGLRSESGNFATAPVLISDFRRSSQLQHCPNNHLSCSCCQRSRGLWAIVYSSCWHTGNHDQSGRSISILVAFAIPPSSYGGYRSCHHSPLRYLWPPRLVPDDSNQVADCLGAADTRSIHCE